MFQPETRPRLRDLSPQMLQASRRLRAEATAAEEILWQALRGDRLDGFRFRRQHAIGRFVLDFYCPARRIAVEIDGGVHDEPDQAERDEARTQALEAQGIAVFRLRNEQILSDLPRAVEQIRNAVSGRPARFK
ncbi:MAG TPA: endonuclease domain-containing protein [Longimicrobium sp.]|nr:endonuclease domain-containing protein [Longimicrobium sp.]